MDINTVSYVLMLDISCIHMQMCPMCLPVKHVTSFFIITAEILCVTN